MLLFAVLATGINHLEQPLLGLNTTIDYKQLTVDLLAQLGDHLTLETVQALLLLTWKEEGCSHSEQAWVHLGNRPFLFTELTEGYAIRVAYHLGLNRSCRNWTFLDDEERKAREDCWWSCYVADSVISLRLGRAPTIQEDDYDVGPPICAFEPSAYRVFAHVVRLCRVINRVIREFYNVRRKATPVHSRVARDELHVELMTWVAGLPIDLQLPSTDIVSMHPILTMHLLFNTTLLVLHRPFLGDTVSEEAYCSAAVASSFILAAYQYTMTGLQSNPFIIQYTLISAIALLYMTQSAEVSVSEPAKTGLQQCLAAFRASSRTWVAATHALKLLANESDAL